MERIVQGNTQIRQVDSHHPQSRLLFQRLNGSGCHHFRREMIEEHKTFWHRINNLFVVEMCRDWNEFILV